MIKNWCLALCAGLCAAVRLCPSFGRISIARVLTCGAALACASQAAHVLVEAESFEQHGGWQLDTQFILIMGSPYLLAHGLGQPVADATTSVVFPKAGRYRVLVRTKDWVARWQAPGSPGKFQLLVNGSPMKEVFGSRGADWSWQEGGLVDIPQPRVTLALRDLTGFDGRCDAILFTDDPAYQPPTDASPMAGWRLALRQLPDRPREAGQFDLVVVGGGYAGTCAAISAARQGCRVALIQDRPVLGGNGSSEIRVWPQGLTRRGLYPRLGEIVEELADRPRSSPGLTSEFNDARREAAVRAEKNLSLFLNHYVCRVETNDQRIVAVIGFDTRTGEVWRFAGRLFADCTGHAVVGYLAGADQTTRDKGHMGMSNMWRWKMTDAPVEFPETPWALKLRLSDFPYPGKNGEWFWESGFDLDPIRDLEYTRDWNLRAVFGAFNAMKNGEGKAEHRRAQLEWVAFVGGTRESRQLVGDLVLSRDDIVARKQFPDGCVPTTWSIDLHYPQEKYQKAYPENPFISRAEFDHSVDKEQGYPVPYRCFYSRNIDNLFMAGRCISVTHEALGTVRVMKTGGMMGEVVGKAAALCVKHSRVPREIYHSHLEELKDLMRQPGAARRDSVNEPLRVPPGVVVPVLPGARVVGIDATQPAGTVIDESEARLTGSWQSGTGLPGYVGDRYLYHAQKGTASARFEFTVSEGGRYEVALGFQAHSNRASNARVTINAADGAHAQRLNQRVAPSAGNFLALGAFEFRPGQTNSVVIDNNGADGLVTIDALRVAPRP